MTEKSRSGVRGTHPDLHKGTECVAGGHAAPSANAQVSGGARADSASSGRPDNHCMTHTPARGNLRLVAQPTRAEFYWQLEPQERAAQEPYGDEEEGYLALDLNRGAAIPSTMVHFDTWPEVSDDVERVLPMEAYSDAVAAVLQLAEWHGLDPAIVCEQALRASRSVFAFASEAALRRVETREADAASN